MVLAICRVQTVGSLMTASRGCSRQPSTDPRAALSTACSRTCLEMVGGSSAVEEVPSELSVGGASSSTSGGSVPAKLQRVSKVYAMKSNIL